MCGHKPAISSPIARPNLPICIVVPVYTRTTFAKQRPGIPSIRTPFHPEAIATGFQICLDGKRKYWVLGYPSKIKARGYQVGAFIIVISAIHRSRPGPRTTKRPIETLPSWKPKPPTRRNAVRAGIPTCKSVIKGCKIRQGSNCWRMNDQHAGRIVALNAIRFQFRPCLHKIFSRH